MDFLMGTFMTAITNFLSQLFASFVNMDVFSALLGNLGNINLPI